MENNGNRNGNGLAPAKHLGGAPKKLLKPALRRQCLKAIAAGVPMTIVSKAIGISPQTLLSFRKQCPEFEEEMQQAQARGIKERLNIVLKSMRSKNESVALRAATWWLQHTRPASGYFAEKAHVDETEDTGNQTIVLVWPHRLQEDNPQQGQTGS